jgi:hypothetical protein
LGRWGGFLWVVFGVQVFGVQVLGEAESGMATVFVAEQVRPGSFFS